MKVRNNSLLKIISSLPIILLALYFIPVLGICLILFRYYMYTGKKKMETPVWIVIVGIVILIPKILSSVFNMVNIDVNTIPYFNNIIKSDLYNVDFIHYSKFLITVGIIFLIVSYVVKTTFDKVNHKLRNTVSEYITDKEKRDFEIAKQNDMEIKIRKEKVKNTSYVKCPSCGSDNIVSDKITTCKFCRRQIENKNYK